MDEIKASSEFQELLNNLPEKPNLPHRKVKIEDGQINNSFKIVSKHIDLLTWEKLMQQCQKRAISISPFLLTLYAEVLSNWSREQNFTLLIKDAANTNVYNNSNISYPIEFSFNNKTSFEEQVRTITFKDLQQRKNLSNRQHFLNNITNENYHEFKASFPVCFVNFDEEQISDVDLTLDSNYVLTFIVTKLSDKIQFSWHFNETQIDEGIIKLLFETFTDAVVKLSVDDSFWGHNYFDFTPEEQIKIRQEINNTTQNFPDKLLHEPFLEIADKSPDNIAIIEGGETINYASLKHFGTVLSSQIIQAGSQLKDLVAIIMNKGKEQIVSVLAVLMTGCAYLPLSPELPEDRLRFILNDAGVKVVLTQKHLSSKLQISDDINLLTVDKDLLASSPKPELPAVRAKSEDLAYIIYTSGSTGVPKGVMIPHKGALNTVLDINSRFNVNENDRVLALSELGFDLSVYDIFGLLSAGGAVVIPNEKSKMFPLHWINLIKENNITIWNSVPAFMSLYYHCFKIYKDKSDLRLTLLSGDWIPVELPNLVRKINPEMEIISLGGATEASIWSIFYPIKSVESDWLSIPYGKPLANQKFYVLNKDLENCPDLVIGELYIGGIGVAKGYFNNDDLTKKSFFIHPKTGEYIYKTGDLGRYLSNGNIEFMGREDTQVKVSGFRIELEEIEFVLNKHKNVKEAIVTAYGKEKNKNKLVAYIVKENNAHVEIEELQNTLKSKLPSYMIPQYFLFLECLPMTSNGKINRKYLPEPVLTNSVS